MGSSDYHSNVLLAFENQDENHLPVVPPDKLEEMKGRFVTVLFHHRLLTANSSVASVPRA